MNAAVDQADYEKLPEFNVWPEEQYLTENGELDILGFRPRASYVLLSWFSVKRSFPVYV